MKFSEKSHCSFAEQALRYPSWEHTKCWVVSNYWECRTSHRSWKGSHLLTLAASLKTLTLTWTTESHQLGGKYLLFCYMCLLVKYLLWTVSFLIKFLQQKISPSYMKLVGAKASFQSKWKVFRPNYMIILYIIHMRKAALHLFYRPTSLKTIPYVNYFQW